MGGFMLGALFLASQDNNNWWRQLFIKKYTTIMAAAAAATKVPANIRENSCWSNACCIRWSDHATKATSKMRIGTSIF